MSLHAIGLGEMTVKSSLDQPFLAEIELIDVGSAPLVGIKVGVADPENFHQIGLERIAVLSLLNFKIEKNAKGKLVIKIQSIERMTEPYMELVVDLTWPNGQLYKAYTVLLDPPGYQLVSTRAQSSPTYYKKYRKVAGHKKATGHTESGVIDRNVITEVQHNPVALKDNKKKTTYGPTITNENVWQIAQRYKTSEVILPQVVLAIVGSNPDAFKEGNLNGLKIGIRLVIPSTREIMEVPAELATQEVMAHDNAWNEKSPINHVLSPPYMSSQTINPVPQINTNYPIINSEIPAIPKFTTIQAITPSPAILPKFISPNPVATVVNTNQQSVQDNKAQNPERDSNIKAEISITTAAVESVRESNALLMEQLHLLQEQNKKLQMQLDKRDKEMETIRAQMQLMMKQRLAVASQANTSSTNNQSSSLWPLWLLFVLAAGGGGFAYWYFKHRETDADDEPYLTSTSVEPKSFLPEVKQTPQKADETTSLSVPAPDAGVIERNEADSQSSKVEELRQNAPIESSKEIKKDDDVVEKRMIKKSESIETANKPVKKQVSKKKEDASLKNEPIIASEFPPENQEMGSKSVALMPDLKETTGKDIKETDNIQKDKTGKEEAVKEESALEFEPQKKQELSNDLVQNQPPLEETTLSSDSKSISEPSEESKSNEESSNHDVLEFESGLHQLIPEKSEKNVKLKEEPVDDNDQSIDFVSTLSPDQNVTPKNQSEEIKQKEKNKAKEPAIKEEPMLNTEDEDSNLKKEPEVENRNIDIDSEITEFFVEPEEEIIVDNDIIHESQPEAIVTSKPEESSTANPLKSKAALNTLLALAKTYIGMDDIESARTSLEEVLEYGSDIQKAEAQRLLDEIKDK